MTLEEIREEAENSYWALWDKADELGRDVKIYLHWTAGHYDSTFPDYHLCIKGNGEVEMTCPFTTIPEATYHRNSGSIAIALCCAYDGYAFSKSDYFLGDDPPTDAQIECAAQIIAVLTDTLNIPIDIQHVMTHAEAADNMDGVYEHDPYGPAHGCTRWDLAVCKQGDEWMSGGDTLRGKAKWYEEHGNLL